MQDTKAFFLLGNSSDHLRSFNGLEFTPREIDVMACLINARGTSKIASFLSIAKKTVVNHIRNIMLKLECNSREGIIDFLEKSHKASLFRKYYAHLLHRVTFEKSLTDIAKLKREDLLSIKIIYQSKDEYHKCLGSLLEKHLRLVGLKVSSEIQEENRFLSHDLIEPGKEYRIYIAQKQKIETFQQDSLEKISHLSHQKILTNILFLILEENNTDKIFQRYQLFNYIDISKEESYYLSFFEIFQKLFPYINIEKIITEFKSQYKNMNELAEDENFSVDFSVKKKEQKRSLISYPFLGWIFSRKSYFITAIFISLNIIGYPLYKFNLGSNEPLIWSSFPLPSKTTFLQRPELIDKIDKEFKNQKDIYTVALVAIGGAGKTTLARQYARMQKCSIAWEINAETQEVLQKSFEDLAEMLAKSAEDKKVLKGILDIKKIQEREEQVILFVREKLRQSAGWILIYDNVENFIDIQKYFPTDSHLWGQGKILITTRNSILHHNTPINTTIQVEELSPDQKLDLFTHIIQQGNSALSKNLANKEKTPEFLKEILSFPLDVSTAASYLKATGISYDKYLESLKTNNQGISEVQEKILKKAGGYQKTRYKITTLSLQELIKNKDFCDLLLLVSLLDSQNIPRSLLEDCKSTSIVDDFICQLNKYSLITIETIPAFSEQTISIHRSNQAIILAYLAGIVRLEKNNVLAQQITHSFKKYIAEAAKKEDMSKMKLLVSHCEKFLTHTDLLHEKNRILVAEDLGWIYFYLGNYSKAIQILEDCQKRLPNHYKDPLQEAEIKHELGVVYNECDDFEKARKLLNESLVLFQKYKGKNSSSVAYNLHHLGMLHFYKGEYETAKEMLKQSSQILMSHYSNNHLDLARVMIRLGEVERALGNYKEALAILEQTYSIYKDHLEKDHYRVGQVLVRIGLVYKDLGHNKIAKEFIEQGLKIYKKHFPSNCDKVAWISGKLGQIENELGKPKEACALLEQSLSTYKKHYPRDFELSWVMGSLGRIYMDLGHYEKARELLEDSLSRHERFYGKNHIETAQIIRELGKLCYLQGDFIKGENLVLESLEIYNNTNHPQAYINFEALAEMYSQKSNQAKKREEVKSLQNIALSYLKKAFEIVQINFPKDSPHLTRIQSKITSLSN